MLARDLANRYTALFAFWILILFGTWTGIPLSAPVPAWMPALSTVATWMTALLLIAVALIGHQTTGGRISSIFGPGSIRFVGFALAAFLAAGLMNLAEASAWTAKVTNFTWFTAARTQLNLYGFFAMAVFGAIYVILPQITGLELPYPRLARGHFWLAALGTLLMVVPWALGGIIQGHTGPEP